MDENHGFSQEVRWYGILVILLLWGSVEQLSRHVAHEAPTFDDAEAGVKRLALVI